MDAKPSYYPDADADRVRDEARRLYGRIIRRGPMGLHDVWNWIAQELDVDKRGARIERLDLEQLATFIDAARRKIEEYKRRDKWSDEPRREAPWD